MEVGKKQALDLVNFCGSLLLDPGELLPLAIWCLYFGHMNGTLLCQDIKWFGYTQLDYDLKLFVGRKKSEVHTTCFFVQISF